MTTLEEMIDWANNYGIDVKIPEIRTVDTLFNPTQTWIFPSVGVDYELWFSDVFKRPLNDADITRLDKVGPYTAEIVALSMRELADKLDAHAENMEGLYWHFKDRDAIYEDSQKEHILTDAQEADKKYSVIKQFEASLKNYFYKTEFARRFPILTRALPHTIITNYLLDTMENPMDFVPRGNRGVFNENANPYKKEINDLIDGASAVIWNFLEQETKGPLSIKSNIYKIVSLLDDPHEGMRIENEARLQMAVMYSPVIAKI